MMGVLYFVSYIIKINSYNLAKRSQHIIKRKFMNYTPLLYPPTILRTYKPLNDVYHTWKILT